MNNKKSKVINKVINGFVKKKNDSDITCKYVIFKDLKLIFMFELLMKKVVYIKINYLIISILCKFKDISLNRIKC